VGQFVELESLIQPHCHKSGEGPASQSRQSRSEDGRSLSICSFATKLTPALNYLADCARLDIVNFVKCVRFKLLYRIIFSSQAVSSGDLTRYQASFANLAEMTYLKMKGDTNDAMNLLSRLFPTLTSHHGHQINV
jgi:hypothetical protein